MIILNNVRYTVLTHRVITPYNNHLMILMTLVSSSLHGLNLFIKEVKGGGSAL